MHLASLFLAAWLAAAAGGPEAARPADRPKPNADPVQAELDRVANLDFARQQAWLRRLEDRADEAAGRTFAPPEAANERERIYRLLHQKRVTFAALRQLLEETQRRERALLPAKTAATPAAAPRVARKPNAANQPPTGPVDVNVEELAARIAGSNLAFREMESTLDEKGVWHSGRLRPLVERAEILVLRRGDLDLLRNLLPDSDRESLAPLESPKATIAELGARIFDARNRAGGAEFKGADDERQAELKCLDALSKRLAEMAEK
jgi:hypothetical protein